jgi:DNA-binding Xre family transcriptional regulator
VSVVKYFIAIDSILFSVYNIMAGLDTEVCMAKKVAFRLRQLRREMSAKEQRDITLKDVSEATGIAVSTLSRLESGSAKGVELETLAKLAAYYKADSGDDLLSVEDARLARHRPLAGILQPVAG